MDNVIERVPREHNLGNMIGQNCTIINFHYVNNDILYKLFKTYCNR